MSISRGTRAALVFLFLCACIAFNTQIARAASVILPGARPFSILVPGSYNPDVPAPLLIALHGYSQSGDKFENYLHIAPIAEKEGILYVHPDGTKDPRGIQFWNATPECCDYQSPQVDDDQYILDIIAEVSQSFSVDPKRIYLVGHSNGGFMVNRMACRHADIFAAVVNISGGSYVKTSDCKPSAPLSVLEIWGTEDVTYKINHYGKRVIPGAVQTFANWAALNRCSKKKIVRPNNLDLDRKIVGTETTVTKYLGCPDNTDIEFWSIRGAEHVPNISQNFTADLVQFLLEHPKDSFRRTPGLG